MTRPPPRSTLFPYTPLFRSWSSVSRRSPGLARRTTIGPDSRWRSNEMEEHTSELQSPVHLVCRLLLEKKKKHKNIRQNDIYRYKYSYTCPHYRAQQMTIHVY